MVQITPEGSASADGTAVPRRSRRGTLIRILVSLGLLAALLSQVDLEVLFDLFERADFRWVAAVVAVQIADRVLMAWKWWLLLNARRRHLGFGSAFKIYYISSFQGFLIPFGVGPDVIRYLKLRKRNIPSETVAASLIVERVLGLFATAVLASLALLLLLARVRTGGAPAWVVPVLLTAAVGAGALLLLLLHGGVRRRLTTTRVFRWLERRIRLTDHLVAIEAYRERKLLLLGFFFWTLVEQLANVLTVYFAARALGLPLAFLDALAFVPISTLLARLPLSVMGLGVREGSFAFFMVLLGFDYTSAIILGLFEFAIFIAVLAPAGLWALKDPTYRRPQKAPSGTSPGRRPAGATEPGRNRAP